jgi:homoserine dehydrogenase
LINVGLLGCGTVGSGVVKLLGSNQDSIAMRVGQNIGIKRILEIDTHKVAELGLSETVLAASIDEILNDEDISIVVELIGGIEPARTFILECMKKGKHVVTANKDLIAVCGEELFQTAEEYQVNFYFEASVGGGIPVIHPLKQYLGGNRINEVIGIVNGTTNYILTKMTQEGQEFARVLKEAQELGYAEADPTADVEGLDAARKIAILASIAFNSRVTFDDVYVEGITGLSPLDIEYGRELGYVAKLLAIAQEIDGRIQARVHPAFIPQHHPLAAVNGVFNAIFINGDAVGELMFYGRGAGQMPTASAVVGDIMEISRQLYRGTKSSASCTCYMQKEIMPIAELESRFYIRLTAKDRPGVLAAIASVFGNSEVSIATVLQKTSGEDFAQLVLVTHYVREADVRDALAVLKGMNIVAEICTVVRVEGEL